MKPSRYEAMYDETGRALRCGYCNHLIPAGNRHSTKCDVHKLMKDGNSYRCKSYDTNVVQLVKTNTDKPWMKRMKREQERSK